MTEYLPSSPDDPDADDPHEHEIEHLMDTLGISHREARQKLGLDEADEPAGFTREESRLLHPSARYQVRKSKYEPKFEPRDPDYDDVTSYGMSDEQRRINEAGIRAVRAVLRPPTNDAAELARRRARDERRSRP